MSLVGSPKQEAKLAEIAQIAKELFPETDVLAVKGALRLGAKAAVAKNGFGGWDEVAAKPAAVRRRFFQDLLEEAKPHLRSSIPAKDMDRFMKAVQTANEKYLKS